MHLSATEPGKGKAVQRKNDYLTGLVEGIAAGVEALRVDQREDRTLVNRALDRVHERLDCIVKKKYVTLEECEARCQAKVVQDIETARLLAEGKRFVRPERAYILYPILAMLLGAALLQMSQHMPMIIKAMGW
jgi:hypothetical protein